MIRSVLSVALLIAFDLSARSNVDADSSDIRNITSWFRVLEKNNAVIPGFSRREGEQMFLLNCVDSDYICMNLDPYNKGDLAYCDTFCVILGYKSGECMGTDLPCRDTSLNGPKPCARCICSTLGPRPGYTHSAKRCQLRK
ncbi:uncharacterized protein LOC101861048 [Aplysia californica]|uniref:Uncharacterized protein LOC101861048 n=1 Tax=Aplysia californica TaxID=6500 RepID=A0ABM0JSQ7_APLCA|nr:uncharacterized protein LOC101861048 [Aplysia californica]